MNIRSDSKSFWKYVNNKRKSKFMTKSMFLNEKKATNMSECCNLFASFFNSVYDHDILPMDCDLNCDIFESDVNSCNVIYTPSISVSEVYYGLRSLKYSLNPGPDGIPSALLIGCCDSLCGIVHYLFNLSLNSSMFPNIWKSSFIYPLFKSGNKNNVQNYRGISKLSCLPKLLELLCMTYINHNLKSLINTNQHGFLRGKSIDTNLIEHVTLIFDGF